MVHQFSKYSKSFMLILCITGTAHIAVQVCMIFQPVMPHSNANAPLLFYGQYVRYSHHHVAHGPDGERIHVPEPGIDMFVVTRQFCFNHAPLGDILLLHDIQQVVQLIPKFGQYADPVLTKDNSMDLGKDFYNNNFADKETFHAILSYQ